MSRHTIICHRCGKSTIVDLSKTISDQQCRACRGFLHGVEVAKEPTTSERKRKFVYRTIRGGEEPEWHDQDAPVIAVRQRWPLFFTLAVVVGSTVYFSLIGFGALRKWKTSSVGDFKDYGQLVTDNPDVRLSPEWRDKATDLAKKALAAQTIEELLPLLFPPEVPDNIIRNYYSTREKLPLGKDLEEDYYVPPAVMTENAVAFWFEDSGQRKRSFVVVEKPTAMLIDWPSLVGFGEMPLDEYIKSMPPQTVVMRARASIGQYYNDYFANTKAWLSLRLSDVTDDHVIHGYVSRENPIHQLIESVFPDQMRDKVPRMDEAVIIVLRQPTGNTKGDQTEIVSLESRTWYEPNGLNPIIKHIRDLEKIKAGEKPREEKSPGEEPPENLLPPTPGPRPKSPSDPAPAPGPGSA